MKVQNKTTGQVIEIADVPTPSKNGPVFYWNVRDILFYPPHNTNFKELKMTYETI